MALHRIKPVTSQVISADLDGEAVRLTWIDNFSMQVITSAVSSPTVSVKLQASNDNINWSDIAGTTNAITSTGNVVINVSGAGYKYVRPSFDHTSGSVTSEVIFVGKERRVK